MPVQLPPPPPEEEKGPKVVSPLSWLTERDSTPVVPDGVTHPSQSVHHAFKMNDEQDKQDEPEQEEPTNEDRQPLLAEVDPNALKGAVTGS